MLCPVDPLTRSCSAKTVNATPIWPYSSSKHARNQHQPSAGLIEYSSTSVGGNISHPYDVSCHSPVDYPVSTAVYYMIPTVFHRSPTLILAIKKQGY